MPSKTRVDRSEPEKLEALTESERKYRSLFESMTEGFVLGEVILGEKGEPYDFRFLEVNKAWGKIAHISRNKATGRTYRELFPQPIEDFIQKHGRVALTGETTSFDLYSPYLNLWFSFYVYSPAKGKFASISTDITQRKQAEEALAKAKAELEVKVKERTAELAESEEKYRLLVDNASEVITVAQDGLIKFMNQQGLMPTGYSPEDLIDKPFLQVVYPDDRKAVEEEVQRHVEDQPGTTNFEFRFVTKDGTIRWAIMNAVNIPWEGKPAVLAIITDITELKLAEEKITHLLGLRTLLTDISTRFINVSVNRLDQEIQDAQRRLCQYLGLDISSSYLPLPEDPTIMKLTYLFHPPEFPPVPDILRGRDYFPWCEQQLISGKSVAVPSTKNLPPEAAVDQASWQHFGIKSSLMFPLVAGENTIGTLSFDTVREECSWPEELVSNLKQIAQVFANAIVRKQSEEILKNSELKFRVVADYTYDWEYWAKPDGSLEYVSPSCERITGYRPEEFVNNPDLLIEIVHPEDRPVVSKHIKYREKVTASLDFRIITRLQEIRWIGHACQPIFTNEGEYLGHRASNRDITERKQAEEAVKLSEEKYRSVVENANEAIVIAQDGKVKYFNPRLLEITGYSGEDLKSKEFLEFIHPEDRRHIAELYRKRISGKPATTSYEYRIIIKDGSTRWMRMNAALVTWEGKPATLNIFYDVTGEKTLRDQIIEYARRITQVQEAERKRISYELHDDTAQYLSILKMQLGSILDSEKILSPNIKEKLQYLEKDADMAFNDVRRYSHELRPVTLERGGLIAALEQIVEDYNKLGQLTIAIKIGGEEPSLSEEVKLGFFRIAQEALNNARKHAKARRVTIIVTFQETKLKMSVRDDGIGFDVKEAAAKASGKGSLGLMSMRERADLIGGTLKIASKPGTGTTIIVERSL
jgi:PAS domain S-box-containing protein